MRGIAILCLAAARLWAQPPEIRAGGVINAASRTPSILPGGALARGALFEILGVRLGTTAKTTSVMVAAPGARVPVPLLAVSPERILARMPGGAPLGDVALFVTVNGVAGAAYKMTVTRANFGIYSRNQQGWGPARVDNMGADAARAANSPRNSAQPGQAMVLAGTGLGDSRPEVWVGSRRAPVDSMQRGKADAPDEISFRLPPDTPSGCYVPLQVRELSSLPSNTVTISVHAGGGACEPPPGFPVAAWSGRSGVVVISRTVRLPGSATVDEAIAVFARRTEEDSAPDPVLLIPPLGTCSAYTGAIVSGRQPMPSAGDAVLSSMRAGLDAGSPITLARGNQLKVLAALPDAAGAYRLRSARGGPLFLEPGNLTVASAGGADIGPFHVSLPAPDAFVWENRDAIATVDRHAGVTLRWRQAASGGVMLIGLTSVDPSGAAWGGTYCAASSGLGSFTIPFAALANLPASKASATLSASYLPLANQRAIAARGLDNGLAAGMYVQTREVEVR